MHIVWIRMKNDPMNIIAKRDNAKLGVWCTDVQPDLV